MIPRGVIDILILAYLIYSQMFPLTGLKYTLLFNFVKSPPLKLPTPY